LANYILLLILIAIGLALLTGNSPVNFAVAAGKGNGGTTTGPVIQEQVNTGSPSLDNGINNFYNCISKTHQDPPSIQIVDNCYYQTLSGGFNSGDNNNNNHAHNHKNNSVETLPTGIASPPPGVLVEVP
jgi:hypothetical protein